ncbi:MAG: hypothetical protein IJ388_00545 [Oscillospiraceae bacterium]|nr:hypothetical protein [Oscillospiraceae bacterium]
MKKFPKIVVALLVVTLFVAIFSTVSFAASDLKEVRLTVDQLKVGYYNDLDGDIVIHCANSDVTKETKNLVDNKSYPFYWSKPYAFNDLKAYGGSKVPAILIDVANGGEGVAICGYEMQLREYLDCIPYSFEIQATRSAGSNEWVSIFADDNTTWNEDEYHCEFDEETVYKVRILFYDIGDADVAKDTADAYVPLPTNTTRLSLSEINLLTKRTSTTTPTEAPTQAPTQAPTEEPTSRPIFTVPTTAPTQAPTAAPTVAPTQAPTAAPTAAPTEAPTQAATQAPTQIVTQAPTQAATQAPTQAVTTPATEPTSAETTPTDAAPTEPTVEPTVPAETAPTETMNITTVPATAPATQPEATNPINDGGEVKPDGAVIIIIAIVAAAAIAGGAVFFIIKKKRG